MTKTKNIPLLSSLLVLMFVLFLVDLAFGSLQIPLRNVVQSLLQPISDNIQHEIIRNIRLPKAITAILTGAALSIAGLMMQTLFRNPLPDPYILGVSSGASLGVAILVMFTGTTAMLIAGTWSIVLAAIIGASAVLLMVIAVSYKVENSVSLLLIGIMLGMISGSIVSIIQYFSNPDSIKMFILWSMGSLSAVSWQQLQVIAPLVLVGMLISIILQKKLNALLLGENYALGLGVNIRQTRILIVISTGILAGTITAFTGPIAFIGIAVPHLARGIFKTSNHEILLPASLLLGANMLLICDIVSQMPTYPLPINTISALFGAPIIIWIILKRR